MTTPSPDIETIVISKGWIYLSLWGFPMNFPQKVRVSLTFCRGFLRVSLSGFGFPSRFARVSLGFPSILKVWVSLTFCKGFPWVSLEMFGFPARFAGVPLSGFGFPSRFARVSFGFPSKGLGFPDVLQGFPSGFLLKVWATLTFYRGFCLPSKGWVFCPEVFFSRPGRCFVNDWPAGCPRG